MTFSANRLLIIILLFIMLGFGLLSFSQGSMDFEPLIFGLIVSALFVLIYVMMKGIFHDFDRPLFFNDCLLIGIRAFNSIPNESQKREEPAVYAVHRRCAYVFVHGYYKIR